MKLRRVSAGFILPTVVIASVILFGILSVAVSTVESTSQALSGEVYQNMAKDAASSGLHYADSCIDVFGFSTIIWNDGTALHPSDSCVGASGCANSSCYISNDGRIRTTFQVTAAMSPSSATVTLTSVGEVDLMRSDGSVWKSSNFTSKEVRGASAGSSINVVSVGVDHACALDSTGKAYCWGSNVYGQLGDGTTTNSVTPVAVTATGVLGNKLLTSIVVNQYFSCALDSIGRVFCWGQNSSGQLGNGTTTSSSTPVQVSTGGVLSGKTMVVVAAGYTHACAVDSAGKAYCWGSNSSGELGNSTNTASLTPVATTTSGVLNGKTVIKITAGNAFTCVIDNGSKAYCWGQDTYGQLGNSSTTSSNTPVAITTSGVLNGKLLASIAASTSHACTLDTAGIAYCWGQNTNGKLGNGSTVNATSPVLVTSSGVLSGKTLVSISAGANHSCAVDSAGKAYCWGLNGNGQLGNGTMTSSTVPVAVIDNGVLSGVTLTTVSSGANSNCALGTKGKVYCWGQDSSGQLGNSNTVDSSLPVSVVSSSPAFKGHPSVVEISTGLYQTCAIDSNGKAYCWGNNADGELGNNSETNTYVPAAVYTNGALYGKTLVSISTYGYHTCALDNAGKAYCWGYNGYGELGNGNTSSMSVPVAVTDSGVLSGKVLISIATGLFHTCALDDTGRVYCWGYDGYGQLGNNSTTSASSPVAVTTSGVLSGKVVQSIAVGYYHTCALDTTGKAYCWGYNNLGQIGDGTTTNYNVPTAVNTSGVLSGRIISTIAAGLYHTCAIDTGSKAYCWGNNGNGQLGNGSTTSSSLPVVVTSSGVLSGKTLVAVAAGYYHSCALDTAGKVYCWGSNGDGQVGNGDSDTTVPMAVLTSGALANRSMVTLDAGARNTCALDAAGRAYCWGNNDIGQLGMGSATNNNSPLLVLSSTTFPGGAAGSIYASIYGGCALDNGGKAYCWGNNANGQIGNNSTVKTSTPVAVVDSGVLAGKTLSKLAMRQFFTCALDTAGKAYCWGYNGYGELGNGTTTQSTVPVAVTTTGVLSGKVLTSITVGGDHTCAIDSAGKAYCWGNGGNGQLGNGTVTSSSLPVAVTTTGVLSGKTLVAISASANYTCALDSTGLVYCWGDNSTGQFGNGTTTGSSVPVAVTTSGSLSGKTVVAIAAATQSVCALDNAGLVYCWGANTNGQLGVGNTTNSNLPAPVVTSGVLNGKVIKSIAAGDADVCALDTNGSAYCWGSNVYGQLGNGSFNDSTTPVTVIASGAMSGATITSLAVGNFHTCALDSRSWVFCWGSNRLGQYADGKSGILPVRTLDMPVFPVYSAISYY